MVPQGAPELGAIAAPTSRSRCAATLDALEWIDATLQGWRWKVLVGLGAAGIAVHGIGDAIGAPWLAILLRGLFAAYCIAVCMGRLSIGRNETTGGLDWRIFHEKFRGALDDFREGLVGYAQWPVPRRWSRTGGLLLSVGLVASEGLIVLSDGEPGATMRVWFATSLGATGLGALATLWGWKRANDATTNATQGVGKMATMSAAIRELPAVIRCDEPATWRVRSPLLAVLVREAFRFRAERNRSEMEHERVLLKNLRRSLTFGSVEQEHWIKNPAGIRRRIDIMMEAGSERLLVELKSRYESGAVQRAMGQIREYLHLNVGPVIVLLCDPPDNANSGSLCRDIASLHAQGAPVLAILAVQKPTAPPADMEATIASIRLSPSRNWHAGFASVLATAIVATAIAYGQRPLSTPTRRERAAVAPAEHAGPGRPTSAASAPGQGAIEHDTEVGHFVDAWVRSVIEHRASEPLDWAYAARVKFRDFSAISSPERARQFWSGAFASGDTLDIDLARSRWHEEAVDHPDSAATPCGSLEEGQGNVVKLRLWATEFSRHRSPSVGCPTIQGVYILRLRRVSGELKICHESWSLREGVCSSCPAAAACTTRY